MKTLRIAGIAALAVLCVGMAVGQDAAHDVDKGATKTGHVVKRAGMKVGHATKSGVKDVGRGTKVVAKDSVNGTKSGVKDAGRRDQGGCQKFCEGRHEGVGEDW
jgi:hypothetical protein